MPTLPNVRSVVHFGAFDADLSSGELHKHGHKVKLQEQPFQVLVMLLERPGTVITREELRARLWPADTFVDFDTGLNSAIKKLRDALGDSAEDPVYVETLPRRGYRFISAIEATHESPAMASIAARAAPVASAREQRDERGAALTERVEGKRVLGPAAFGILALIGVATLLYLLNPGGIRQKLFVSASPPKIQSLAVLPLENLTGDPAQEYFADVMTDALITDLAQVSSLRVISRASTMQYKGAHVPLADVARKLNVDAFVEGSVAQSGNRVRITAQLINAGSDRHMWAHSYESDLRDVLTLQDNVARDITQQVRVKLTPQEQSRLARNQSVNPEAYDYYLRGRFHAYDKNREDLEAAIGLLENSVRLDPNFALPHAYLARTYAGKAFLYQRENTHLKEMALAHSEQALALEPNLAEAHFARAGIFWTHSNHFPHEEAVRELHRAIELNPNFDEAHQQLGAIYNHIGLLDKAADELQKALAINPTYTGARFRMGINLLSQGKYEQALVFLNDTQRFIPSMWTFQTALALFELGRKKEASTLISEFLRTEPQDEGGVVTAMQALLLADSGRRSEAEQMIQAAIKRGEGFGHFHHTAYAVGSAFALMNKPQQALKWLQMAADDGFPCYPMYESDPILNNLRRDPHFIEFLAQLKRQWEQYKAAL
jgi:TolB-like protein/DNA-binding winged helix-turn-helix (wHTH) protein/tetratricopeptide (TPR) repeat protein